MSVLSPQEYIRQLLEPEQTVNALLTHLGAKAEEISAERAVVSCTAEPRLLQGVKLLAGGITAALLDEAMAYAVLARLHEGQSTTTVDLNVRYFRSVQQGVRVRAEAWVEKAGGRIMSVEGRVLAGPDDVTAAKGSASFLVL